MPHTAMAQSSDERLARIEVTLLYIKERIDEDRARMTTEFARFNTDITALQRYRWRTAGAVAAIFVLFEFLSGGGSLSLKSLLK